MSNYESIRLDGKFQVLESYSNYQFFTGYAMEGVGERAYAIVNAIIKFFKKIIDELVIFFKRLTGTGRPKVNVKIIKVAEEGLNYINKRFVAYNNTYDKYCIFRNEQVKRSLVALNRVLQDNSIKYEDVYDYNDLIDKISKEVKMDSDSLNAMIDDFENEMLSGSDYVGDYTDRLTDMVNRERDNTNATVVSWDASKYNNLIKLLQTSSSKISSQLEKTASMFVEIDNIVKSAGAKNMTTMYRAINIRELVDSRLDSQYMRLVDAALKEVREIIMICFDARVQSK